MIEKCHHFKCVYDVNTSNNPVMVNKGNCLLQKRMNNLLHLDQQKSIHMRVYEQRIVKGNFN